VPRRFCSQSVHTTGERWLRTLTRTRPSTNSPISTGKDRRRGGPRRFAIAHGRPTTNFTLRISASDRHSAEIESTRNKTNICTFYNIIITVVGRKSRTEKRLRSGSLQTTIVYTSSVYNRFVGDYPTSVDRITAVW